jgi:hypothetical protein
MDQAIDTSEINKGAKGCDAGDSALAPLAHLQAGQRLSAFSITLLA